MTRELRKRADELQGQIDVLCSEAEKLLADARAYRDEEQRSIGALGAEVANALESLHEAWRHLDLCDDPL